MDTPIYDFLTAYSAGGMVRCHMPGHKGHYPTNELSSAFSLDITEISGADSLFEAEGIIAESEKYMSRLYHTAETVYSAGGSTLCIQAMLALMKQDGWPKGLKKVITFLAPYTLGVYLLHEHLLVRYQWPLWLGSQRVQGAWDLLVFWILGILCVFTVGVVTDFVRDRLFRLMACLPPIKVLGGLIRKADGIFASQAEELQKAGPDGEEDKKNAKSDGA